MKSSEIEGEKLAPEHARSSIARWFGMDIAGLVPADRNFEGVVEMTRRHYGKTEESPLRSPQTTRSATRAHTARATPSMKSC